MHFAKGQSRFLLTFTDLRLRLANERIAAAFPSDYLRFDVDPYALVKDEATYVGEQIAMVVADSR
jgi:hypothetical protein